MNTIHPWIQPSVLCSSKFIVLWRTETTEVTHQDSLLSGSYRQFEAWSTQEIPPRIVLFLSAWTWALHENIVDSWCAWESYLSHDERLSSLLTCQSLVCVWASCNDCVRLTIFHSKKLRSWGRSDLAVLVRGSCCQSDRGGNFLIEFYEISTMNYVILRTYNRPSWEINVPWDLLRLKLGVDINHRVHPALLIVFIPGGHHTGL